MIKTISTFVLAVLLAGPAVFAHPGHDHSHSHDDDHKEEQKTTEVAAAFTVEEEKKVDGQNDWLFFYRPDLSTLPVDDKYVREAHGGLAVDRKAAPESRFTFFGLPGVGLLSVSPDLAERKVIGGDKELFNAEKNNPAAMWNYHNAAPVYAGDELFIGLPGNNSGKVWIVDTSGKIRNTFGAPDGASGRGPTDLLQVPGSGVIKVTYGYGDKRIYEADPFSGDLGVGEWNPGSFGGPGPRTSLGVFSRPHGITMFPGGKLIAVADREYGRQQHVTLDGKPVSVWDFKVEGTEDKDKRWPNPCDVDFSPDGKHAVVGNLNGIGGSTSTFLIVDVETGKTLSTVTPASLGVPNSRHIHNACFRYVPKDGRTEVYVLCLFWRPGGYAVFQKVQPWHTQTEETSS